MKFCNFKFGNNHQRDMQDEVTDRCGMYRFSISNQTWLPVCNIIEERLRIPMQIRMNVELEK